MSSGSICFTDFECNSTLVCSSGVCASPYRRPTYILGSIVGLVIAFIALGICLFLCIRSRRAKRRREAEQRERERLFMQQQAYPQQPQTVAAYQMDGIMYNNSPAPSSAPPYASPYPPSADVLHASPHPSVAVSPLATTPGSFPNTPGGYTSAPAPYSMPSAIELPSESRDWRAAVAKEPALVVQPVAELPADSKVDKDGLNTAMKKS